MKCVRCSSLDFCFAPRMKPSLSLSLGWGLGSGPLIFLAETGQESASKSLGFVFALHLRPETRQGLVPVPRLIPTDNLHKAAPGGGHFYRATIAPPSSNAQFSILGSCSCSLHGKLCNLFTFCIKIVHWKCINVESRHKGNAGSAMDLHWKNYYG